MKLNAVATAVLASLLLTAAVASPVGMVEQGRLERMLDLSHQRLPHYTLVRVHAN
jgi:hypothetical protein